jgi:hypothetical protein
MRAARLLLLALLFFPAVAHAFPTGGGTLQLQVAGVAKPAARLNFGSGFSVTGLTGGTLTIAAAGDLLGGRAVSSTAPSSTNVLAWNGSAWAPAAAGTTMWKASVTLTASSIAAKGAVTSGSFALATMPANARLLGITIGEGFVAVDDPTHATWTLTLTGLSSGDLIAGQNVSAGQTGFPTGFGKEGFNQGPAVFVCAPVGGVTLTVGLASTVNLSTVTAGNVAVSFFYTVLP